LQLAILVRERRTDMSPTRGRADPMRVSPGTRGERAPTDSRPALVLAVIASEVERFPSARYVRFVAHTTSEAIRLLEQCRPRAVVIDWDVPEFDGPAICDVARRWRGTGILVITANPKRVPSALKAGCHSVLLKPLVLNLVSARLGRLAEAMATAAAGRVAATLREYGTNRTWPEIGCPECGVAGALSFEHSSHRRSWYACLQCDAVWLARTRE
jgi:CheY-like chemotaxis protein